MKKFPSGDMTYRKGHAESNEKITSNIIIPLGGNGKIARVRFEWFFFCIKFFYFFRNKNFIFLIKIYKNKIIC